MNDLEDCDPSIPLEEFLGPSGPKLEPELKMSSRGLPAPGSQKVKNRVEKDSKSGNFNSFSIFFDSFSTLFLTFWDPGVPAPGTHFQLRFPLWARRAQELL